MIEQEGVLKFQLEHRSESLRDVGFTDAHIEDINGWRSKLMILGLIGAVPERYGGLGFGNLSCRTADGFLITGSQTGHLTSLGLEDYAEVTLADTDRNLIVSRGGTRPSSESLTHAAVYRSDMAIQAVFHVHSPELWRQSHPATAADIPYGTPDMARAVTGLIQSTSGLFTMQGHEDGVVSYGTDCQEAGLQLNIALDR